MSQLVELPNETLEQIMKSFLPNEIDEFSICCKHFYVLSAKIFPEHKKRKKQYSYASCGKHIDGILCFWHPVYLLRALFENPETLGYVKTLELWKCYDPEKAKDTANELQEELQATVNSFQFLTAKEKETWIQGLLSGSQGPAIALVASMLPCLESLVIRFRDKYGVLEELEGFMVAAARPGHTTGAMVLGKLSQVDYTAYGRNASVILLFARLPSMRIFRAIRMLDTGNKWTATHSNSTITKLVLDECELRSESLQCIIGSIAALQQFSYGCQLEDNTDSFRHPPQRSQIEQGELKEIVQSILQSASHSLVSLDLTDHGHTRGEKIKKGHFMGSLQGFQVLKKISVEYRMFVSGWGVRIHRMIDVMPVSVESVTLTGPMLGKKDMAKMLKGLAKHKAEKVPKLGKVFYESRKSPTELGPILKVLSDVRGVDFILKQVLWTCQCYLT